MDDWKFDGLDDLERIGDKVQGIIEDAIDSQNYQKLNQTITQAVNHTIRQYQNHLAENQDKVQRASSRASYPGGRQRASDKICQYR